MTENCVFCKIYAENADVVFETRKFAGQFDKFPVAPGHMEVFTKRHVADFFELTNDERRDLLVALQRGLEATRTADLRTVYRRFIDKPLNAKSAEFCKDALLNLELRSRRDGENIGINNGRAAGRTVDHLHAHIIPRYVGDMANPAGGVRYVIPEKGNYK